LEVFGLKTITKTLYEAMFLVDSAEAASDWEGLETHIKNIFKRAEAEVVSIEKWGERNLAYEIDGKSKGTYVLCYFRGEGKRNSDIEIDVRLSGRIMRVLILCAEGRGKEDIQKDAPAMAAEKDEQEAEVIAQGTEREQVGAVEGEESGGDTEQQEDEEPVENEEPAEESEKRQRS
jgi:small subunit ribosomal protein S6